jgi:hypothetical protein
MQSDSLNDNGKCRTLLVQLQSHALSSADCPGDVLPVVKGGRRLPSIVRRLAIFLLPKGTTSSCSIKSDIPSSPTPLSPDLESPQLNLTSLPRPLISLLEIGPSSRREYSSIPLAVYTLKSCYEDQTRLAAISKLDGASAERLAEIIQAVCDVLYLPTIPPNLRGVVS